MERLRAASIVCGLVRRLTISGDRAARRLRTGLRAPLISPATASAEPPYARREAMEKAWERYRAAPAGLALRTVRMKTYFWSSYSR